MMGGLLSCRSFVGYEGIMLVFWNSSRELQLTRDRRENKAARIVVEHSRKSRGAHGLSVSCLDYKY